MLNVGEILSEKGYPLTLSSATSFRYSYSLIGTLLLGYVDESGTRNDDDESRSYLPSQVNGNNDGFAVPMARPPRAVPSMLPKDDEEEEDIDPLGN
jgi:hypothetical protein